MTKKEYDLYDLQTWSIKQLKDTLKLLHHAIHQLVKYKVSDVAQYEAMKEELKSRGYEIHEVHTVTIMKGLQ